MNAVGLVDVDFVCFTDGDRARASCNHDSWRFGRDGALKKTPMGLDKQTPGFASADRMSQSRLSCRILSSDHLGRLTVAAVPED